MVFGETISPRVFAGVLMPWGRTLKRIHGAMKKEALKASLDGHHMPV
jgi:hypothetical protein